MVSMLRRVLQRLELIVTSTEMACSPIDQI